MRSLNAWLSVWSMGLERPNRINRTITATSPKITYQSLFIPKQFTKFRLYYSMRIEIHHYLHQDPDDDSKVIKLLRQIINLNTTTVAKIDELNQKVTDLQAAVDT